MYRGRRVVAVVLARLGSRRLPGKVLLPFGEGTVLSSVARRLGACRFVDELVLATSTEARDDAVAAAGSALGLPVARGSEEDVVGRMVQALGGQGRAADVVVRACADNPLVMPTVVDDAVMELVDTGVDVITPFEHASWPFGFGLVAMTRAALARIDGEALHPAYREHVESYCFEAERPFRLRYHVAPQDLDYPELCATLDQPVDLFRLRRWREWLDDTPLEHQPAELVRRVREARVWYEGLSRAGGLEWDLVVASDPEPLRSLAPDLPLGLVTVERIESREGRRFALCYHEDCGEPFPREPIFVDWRPARPGETPRSFLARVAPFARRLLGAGPVRAAAEQEGGPAPQKAPHAERREGFRSARDARFPPRVAVDLGSAQEPLETARHLSLALEGEPFERLLVHGVPPWDAGLALLRQSLGPERVLRVAGPPPPDPFGTLRVDGDGRAWVVERGPSMALGQTGLASFWRSPAVRRARVHVLNAAQILAAETG